MMRAILTYHSLDDSGSCISVPPERFRRQMAWLREQDVRVVPPDELLALPDHVDAVTLTFDDGIANLVTSAVPVLSAFGWAATVFAVTRFVGGDNRFRGGSRPDVPVLPLLDWEDLTRLQASGWTVGSHTLHHPRLPLLDDAALDQELEGAAEDIETRLGVRPRWFAYPYGDLDQRVAGRVGRYYARACTTAPRPLGPADDPVWLPRLDARDLTGFARRMGWGAGLRTFLRGRGVLRRIRRLAIR